ncbi:MAG: peptide deformylase [Rhodothermales bacterium]
MILPIRVYGDPALRTETEDVSSDSEELQQLINDMIETMRGAEGVGLAAPQVGRTERVFVADVTPMYEAADESDVPGDLENLPPQPMVFVNPTIVWESDEASEFEEGCLSIPDIREIVVRPLRVRITYLDQNFEARELEVGEMLARVIQHEIDHLDGVLFVDHISAFRRRLLRRKLRDMSRGDVEADYELYTSAA